METLDASDVIDRLGLEYFRGQASLDSLTDEVIVDLLYEGTITRLARGEYIARFDESADDFQIVLEGKLAYYKHCDGHSVLTRYFAQGEQVGFDEMIGLINRDGTDVATEDSLLLSVSSELFFDLHLKYPAMFGIFMINLARELSREIEMLEDVVSEGTGWAAQPGTGA